MTQIWTKTHGQLVSEACADGCAGDCHQGRKPCHIAPAEASSELGFENEPAPRRRLGPLTSIERRLLSRNAPAVIGWTVAAVSFVYLVARHA